MRSAAPGKNAIHGLWFVFAAPTLIGMSACGGASAQTGSHGSGVSTGSTVDATGAAALMACSWPAGVDAGADSSGQCIAARTYLACQGSNGGGENCLSNDPTQCPNPNLTAGVTFSDCNDQCHADEYAVGCGGPGPGPYPAPPAGCRSLPSGPGGGTISCCPCGEAGTNDSGSDPLVWSDDDGGSFSCASAAACDGHLQVCEHVLGGPPPGADFYACIPIPASCESDVSCACVTSALRGRGASDCAAAGSNITVQIDVP